MAYLKKLLKHPLLYLLILWLISLNPLFKPGVWPAADLNFHFARLGAFYHSLMEGNIFPRWGGNLYYGYGYPILMIYYPLGNYLGSFFHFIGFSLTDSLKLIFIATYILSGVLMYLWLKDWLSQKAAILGTVLFQFAPYRFVNMYDRGTIGETLGYVFIPLCFWMIYKFIKEKTGCSLIRVILSLAGMLLAHNLIFLLAGPILLVYIVYLLFNQSQADRVKIICGLVTAGIFAAGLAAFYWLPVFLEGLKYTGLNQVTSVEYYNQYFLQLEQLFYSAWGYGGTGGLIEPSPSSVMIGIGHWIVTMLSIGYLIFLVKRRPKKIRQIFIVLALVAGFMTAIFLMLPGASFLTAIFPLILRPIQFPGRLRTVAIICSSLLGAILAHNYRQSGQTRLVAILATVTVLSVAGCWQVAATIDAKPDEFWLENYDQPTDVGESKPIWLWIKNQQPNDKIATVSGSVINIDIKKWQSEIHEYELTAKIDSIVGENTAYFPGWTVLVDGKKTPIEFQNRDWAGLITYPVIQGKHQVKVIFKETRIRLLADIISLMSLAAIIIICRKKIA